MGDYVLITKFFSEEEQFKAELLLQKICAPSSEQIKAREERSYFPQVNIASVLTRITNHINQEETPSDDSLPRPVIAENLVREPIISQVFRSFLNFHNWSMYSEGRG